MVRSPTNHTARNADNMTKLISYRPLLLSASVFFSLALSAHAQTSDDKLSALQTLNPRGALPMSDEEKNHIEELLRVSGANTFSKTLPSLLINQITSMLHAANPAISANVVAIVSEEINKVFIEQMDSPGGMMDLSATLYHKYFTDEEIMQMIAFYVSPIGQKSVAVLPLVAKESLADGQRMGRELAPIILQRIKDRFARQDALASSELTIDTPSAPLPASAEATVQQLLPKTQAMAQAPSIADMKSIAKFINIVRARVRRNTIFTSPSSFEGNPFTEVETELFKDGAIRSVKIMKSSGIAGYDQAVMTAVQNSSPFPMPDNGKMPTKLVIKQTVREK